jgi:hypothetical protein
MHSQSRSSRFPSRWLPSFSDGYWQREQNSALKTELESAECAIDILKLNVEKINYENRWLHGELNNVTMKKVGLLSL